MLYIILYTLNKHTICILILKSIRYQMTIEHNISNIMKYIELFGKLCLLHMKYE